MKKDLKKSGSKNKISSSVSDRENSYTSANESKTQNVLSVKNVLLITASVTGGIIIAVLSLILIFILIALILQTPTTEKVSLEGTENSIDELKTHAVWVRRDCPDLLKNNSMPLQQSGSGVIWSVSGSTLQVLTNRHVLVCASENTTSTCPRGAPGNTRIRLSDGGMYNVSDVRFAPGKLDVALLTLETPSFTLNSSLSILDKELEVGDEVIAISFPGFAEEIVEFVAAEGTVLARHDLLTSEGLLFKGTSSDAFASFGSSGGGLFDKRGQLAGLISWGSADGSQITALDIQPVRKYIEEGKFEQC